MESSNNDIRWKSINIKVFISLALALSFSFGILPCSLQNITDAKQITSINKSLSYAKWESASNGLPTGENYYGVVFDDINGDNKIDVVSASDGRGVAIYLGDNNGNWTFKSSGLPTSGGFEAVKICDINNDGKKDILATSPGYITPTPFGIHAYEGDGKGNFTDVTSSTGLPTKECWQGLDYGDVNNDGNLDIVACGGNGSNKGIHLFIGNGAGQFTEESAGLKVNQNVDNCGILFADFNNDGNLDIASGGWKGPAVLLGNGGKGGSMQWTKSTVGLPYGKEYFSRFVGIDAIDVNNDGLLDLAMASYPGYGPMGFGVRVYKNVNNASSWVNYSTGLPSAGLYVDVRGADFNHDGNMDLITGGIQNTSACLRVFYGNSKGVWVEDNGNLPSPPPMREFVAFDVGDMNYDGKTDFVAGRYRGAGIEVWKNNMSGPPIPTVTYISPFARESWTGGFNHSINWSISTGTPPYSITLKYSTDGGASYPYTITSGLTQNAPGEMGYRWNVPLLNSNRIKIRIEVIDSQSQTAYSCSPMIFKIYSDILKSTNPEDKEINVQLKTNISLTFSKAMNREKTDSAIKISPDLIVKYAWESGNATVNLVPEKPLNANTIYTV